MVYVVDRHGKPLMPTKRHGKVRRLLKSGLAVPISTIPFVIKLKYDTPGITQDLWLGIDPGRENIGVGVSKENGECVFESELRTNNKTIKKNMDERRGHRQARRRAQRTRKQRKAVRDGTEMENGQEDTFHTKKSCKSRTVSYPRMEKGITHKVIQGREAQFANRKKRCDLTPSGRQLIQMHVLCVEKIMSFLPIRHVNFERNSFDFQWLENQDIKAWEYSRGPLYGYRNYKDYIHAQQGGTCLLCGENPVQEYHHIVPRSRGGSDTPANIAGLCRSCHNGIQGVHKSREAEEQLLSLKAGLCQKYKVSLLNSVMPVLIEELDAWCKDNGISFGLTDGKPLMRPASATGSKNPTPMTPM